MKALAWRLLVGALASALLIVAVLVVFAERIDSIALSGDARYVEGYAYDLDIAVVPPVDGDVDVWSRSDGGDWVKLEERARVTDGSGTVRVTPTGALAEYRVSMHRVTSEAVAMRDTPLTMTATGPATYVEGRPAIVTIRTDPPVSDHAEAWFDAGGAWEDAGWAVPVVDGEATVPLYPTADGSYQFRIGQTSTDEVALAEDDSVPDAFVFQGSGWGHGVGMSQYGAASMARHGFTETQILTHYYAGTRVQMLPVTGSEDADGDATVRVQVFGSGNDSRKDTILRVVPSEKGGDGAWTLTFYTASSSPITDGGKPRRLTGTVGDDIAIHASGTTISATLDGVKKSGSIAVLTWSGTTYKDPESPDTPIVTIVNDEGHSVSNGTYRHGKLVIGTAGGRRLNVVNVLKLNSEYLYGIAEVPSSWETEALQAQAIAARNYAVANRGYSSSCDCQLYDDTRSQNFTGWNKESQGATGQWGARWVAAVDATTSDDGRKGMMLTYGSGGLGNLVTAFYFSSSGGEDGEQREGVGRGPELYPGHAGSVEPRPPGRESQRLVGDQRRPEEGREGVRPQERRADRDRLAFEFERARGRDRTARAIERRGHGDHRRARTHPDRARPQVRVGVVDPSRAHGRIGGWQTTRTSGSTSSPRTTRASS